MAEQPETPDKTWYKVGDGYYDGNGNPVTESGKPKSGAKQDDEGDADGEAGKRAAAVAEQPVTPKDKKK